MQHSFWPLICGCPVVYLDMKSSQCYLLNQIQIENIGCVLSAWLGREEHSFKKKSIFTGENENLMTVIPSLH